MACDHDVLCLDPSSHAQQAGYTRRTLQQRVAASRPSGRAPAKSNLEGPDTSTFPAPLLLPGDDLAWDPKYDTQSLKSWLQEPDRNQVTDERKTVYVVPVPSVATKVKHVKDWCQPKLRSQSKASAPRPDRKDVVEYVSAFYTNLPVKLLTESKLQFTSWDDGQPAKKRSKVSYIGLAIGTQVVRIRARPSSDGIFDGQLNLEDILDAAIELLPTRCYFSSTTTCTRRKTTISAAGAHTAAVAWRWSRLRGITPHWIPYNKSKWSTRGQHHIAESMWTPA